MLSRRAQTLLSVPPSLVTAHFTCLDDPYDPIHNASGYINLGTAENHLLWDLLEPKLITALPVPHQAIHYDYLYGALPLRQALARYLERYTGAPSVDPEALVVAAGASAVVDIMATVLCDPGDCVLIPAPYYPGFDIDLRMRPEAIPVPIPLSSANNFQLTLSDIEQAFDRAVTEDISVKAILLSSPNNPLGCLYPEPLLREIIAFCDRNNLACIIDEIYMNSIHGDGSFVSALRLVEGRTNVHIVNGLAKDFCMSGFKIGFAWSADPDVIRAMRALCHVHPASTHTQFLMTHLFNDVGWIDGLIQENHNRLRHAYQTISKGLQGLGIPFCPAEAGFFIFLNLSAALEEDSFDGELVLWRRLFEETKLNISPGGAFHHTEPGWFRLCFAKPDAVLQEALQRISQCLK